MSQETSLWLNTMTLIGMTEKRGNAWHYRASEQGETPNHYPLAIPVADVRSRLFHWKPLEGDVMSNVITLDGVQVIKDPDRKTIVRPMGSFGDEDQGEILGIFKKGYKIHDYDEWLVTYVENILDADLAVSSAGLLKGGAVAWVEISVPDTITLASGVEFRPNLLAATSLDGSLSSTYKRTITNTVCDNTMASALGEAGPTIKVKHSKYSNLKLAHVKNALDIIHETADSFAAEVERLTNTTVTDAQFDAFLESLAPTKADDGEAKTGRGLTLATDKHDTLRKMWKHDLRVAPWTNTAWGVIQAVNTATHHEFTVRGMGRAERNALRAVEGGVDTLDRETLETLNGVLTPA